MYCSLSTNLHFLGLLKLDCLHDKFITPTGGARLTASTGGARPTTSDYNVWDLIHHTYCSTSSEARFTNGFVERHNRLIR